MTRSLVSVLIVASVVAAGAQAATPQGAPPAPPMVKTGGALDRAAIEKALAANEQKISDAIIKGDAAAFKAMVATEAWTIDPGGLMTATDFAAMIKPGMAKVTGVKLSAFKVLWVDATTAVLTYTWEGKGTFMDQPVQSPSYCSTTYTKRAEKWVAVFHQETTAAPKK